MSGGAFADFRRDQDIDLHGLVLGERGDDPHDVLGFETRQVGDGLVEPIVAALDARASGVRTSRPISWA